MVLRNSYLIGILLNTEISSLGASWSKTASGGKGDRVRRLTCDRLQILHSAKARQALQQCLRVGMTWVIDDIECPAHLHYLTCIHDRDPVADFRHHSDIMADEDETKLQI